MKNGLEAASMILSASTCFPSSQTRVTLVRSLSSLNSRKATLIFVSKSFHLKQNFSQLDIFVTRSLVQVPVGRFLKIKYGNKSVRSVESRCEFSWRKRATKPLSQVVFGIPLRIWIPTFRESAVTKVSVWDENFLPPL